MYDEGGAILFPALPKQLRRAEFRRLSASNGVAVSGRIEAGTPVQFAAEAPEDMQWKFRVPSDLGARLPLKKPGMTVKGPSEGLLSVEVTLKKGVNPLW